MTDRKMGYNISDDTKRLIDLIIHNTEIRESFIVFFTNHREDYLLPALEEKIREVCSKDSLTQHFEAEKKTKSKVNDKRDIDGGIYENNLKLDTFNHGARETRSTD